MLHCCIFCIRNEYGDHCPRDSAHAYRHSRVTLAYSYLKSLSLHWSGQIISTWSTITGNNQNISITIVINLWSFMVIMNLKFKSTVFLGLKCNFVNIWVKKYSTKWLNIHSTPGPLWSLITSSKQCTPTLFSKYPTYLLTF